VLLQISDNPVVRLNHAVAVAMVRGAEAGLELLDDLETDARLARDHRLPAVRAHLLEMVGELGRARASYVQAARLATALAHQRYLNSRIARLSDV
jgi:predicted RNA polymerase sigma factor